MKIYLFLSTLVFFLTLTGILSSVHGQWLQYTIDDSLFEAMGLYVADIDGDGDLDVAATSEHGNDVFWYENDSLIWYRHLIDGSLGGAIFCPVADIDGDSLLDVIANGFLPPKVVWYKNNLPGTNWNKYNIADPDGAEYVVAADIDKDDDCDVVLTTYRAGEFVWYENNNLNWIPHTIGIGFESALSVNARDIDGDDTLDVVVTDNDADDLVWYRNSNGGLSWTKHMIDGNLPGAFHLVIEDIDGDNALDIVVAVKRAGDVVWYKNNLPDSNWTPYYIEDNLTDAHYVTVADLDNDNDRDVVVTSVLGNKIVWYENNNLTWIKNNIDENLGGARISYAADIDGDNYKDVVVTGFHADKLVWYKNLLGVAHTQSMHNYPRFISQQGDTLVINAWLYNRDSHPAMVRAIIDGKQHIIADTIQLYDDGLHHDSLASDNIWGNSKWLSGLPEDTYLIGISTHDLTVDYVHNFPPVPGFTTIGPVVVVGDTITSTDKEPNPGDQLSYRFNLQNIGLTGIAENIRSGLFIQDTCAKLVGLSKNLRPSYGNIAPGDIKLGSANQTIYFSDQCSGGHYISFLFEIYSNNNHFWNDTFDIWIFKDPAGISIEDKNMPKEFTLKQNYPNPLNPSTNITFTLPKSVYVTLEVFNTLGQKVATLLDKKLNAGSHDVQFNAADLPSSIYFYRIQAGEFSQVRKMVMLR